MALGNVIATNETADKKREHITNARAFALLTDDLAKNPSGFSNTDTAWDRQRELLFGFAQYMWSVKKWSPAQWCDFARLYAADHGLEMATDDASLREFYDVATRPEVAINTALKVPNPMSIGELQSRHQGVLREPVIDGLLRRTETANLIAAPKAGKSWIAIHIAMCVAAGQPVFDRFPVTQGCVLIVDNELHGETIADRMPRIADAMKIPWSEVKDRIQVDCRRGNLVTFNELEQYTALLNPGQYSLMVLDAFYRMLPEGVSENDNAGMTQVYNTMDKVAEFMESAILAIHHTSKGNQAHKGVTDVGSGAGAQSRAADAHITLREHEEADCLAVDTVVRSFKPVEPFVIRRAFPTFHRVDQLDPRAIKGSGVTAAKAKREDKAREKQQEREADYVAVLRVLRQHSDGETRNAIKELAGIHERRVGIVVTDMRESGTAEICKVTKNNRDLDGVRLTAAGIEESEHLTSLPPYQDDVGRLGE